MKINICDAPGCARPGNLVQQFVARCKGIDPFISRVYLCQWHLASKNRHKLKCQRKLSRIEYKQDYEIFEQENEST